jgi:integrin beta 3
VLPEDIDIVARAIAEVTAPLLERIAVLEAHGAVKGSDGVAGKDGANGLDGKDGRDGIDGKDADPEVIKALVADAVQKAVALIPVAKDGRDGVDGKDGQPGRDGLSGQPGRDGEKGADGLNGKDGADGLGFGDLVAEYDGERRFTIRAVRDERTRDLGVFSIPAQVYRGVWQAGKYDAGDTVTWAGSMWHCNGATSDKPGDGSKAWTLCVKKGADGRVGPEGKAGPQGPRGEQGPQGPKVY